MKFVFVDVGELGWSLMLSMHIRWLRENTSHSLAVIALPDRKCLYRGLVDLLLDVPQDFCRTFDVTRQSCLGLHKVGSVRLTKYFTPHIPEGYVFPEGFAIGSVGGFEKWPRIVESYNYSKKLDGRKEILVFPRCRRWGEFISRNFPKKFYIDLIRELCVSFSACDVRTLGVKLGAYDIVEVKQSNYINGVKDKGDLQELIDRCQLAVAAIGAQSAPPKISLLQGVPTFMMGHEEKRHKFTDNWLQTKAGFYYVHKKQYSQINTVDCISKIIEFIRSCV